MKKVRTLLKWKMSSPLTTVEPVDKVEETMAQPDEPVIQPGETVQPDQDLTVIEPSLPPEPMLLQEPINSNVKLPVVISKNTNVSPPKKWYIQIPWKMCIDSKLRNGKHLKNKIVLKRAQKFKNRYVIIAPFFGFDNKNFNKRLWKITGPLPKNHPVAYAVKKMNEEGHSMMTARLRIPRKPLVVFFDVRRMNPFKLNYFVGGVKGDDRGYATISNPKWRRDMLAFNYYVLRFFSYLGPAIQSERKTALRSVLRSKALPQTESTVLNVGPSTSKLEEEWLDDASDNDEELEDLSDDEQSIVDNSDESIRDNADDDWLSDDDSWLSLWNGAEVTR